MGWNESARAFTRGLVLGQRGAFHDDEMEQRSSMLQQRRKEHDESMALQRTQSKRQGEKHEAWKQKEKFEELKVELDAAKKLSDLGNKRAAAKKFSDAYNRLYPNGDELMMIFKEDRPDDPYWSRKGMEDREVSLVSKKWGESGFKSIDDVFEYAASNLDHKTFNEDYKNALKAVAEKNAAEKSFTGEDGKQYIKTWELGEGGVPAPAGEKPYTGITEASQLQKNISELEKVGIKLTDSQKAIVAGLESKAPSKAKVGLEEKKIESANQRAADANVVAIEGINQRAETADKDRASKEKIAAEDLKSKEAIAIIKAKGAGSAAARKKAEEFLKDLKILSKPFAKPGSQVIDPVTLEITNEGKSAWDAANEFLQKYKDKTEMSSAERRKIDDAKRFLEVFDIISQLTAAKYTGNKGKRSWKDYAGDTAIKKAPSSDQMAISH